MATYISRSDIISAINNTIENDDVRQAAVMAVNRAYLDEHVCDMPSDDESAFFNLVTNYNMLNHINPERYNQHTIEEEAHALFF